MKALLSLLGDIRRLALPYFKSEERWIAFGLLGAVIALELAWVYATVLLNKWNSAFYDAIQDKNFPEFKHQLLIFCAIAAGAIIIAVYQIYLKQWLVIRWRRWLTKRYLDHWLSDNVHYRLRLEPESPDNPDQRIAEDVQMFVGQTISIGVGLLGTIVSLVSFSVILWGLSGSYDLHLFGTAIAIPGYLFWAALIYAIVGTWLAHLIGRRLMRLNYNQQRYEADFRVDLVRVRENSEQIALLNGGEAEERRLSDRFGRIWGNFFDLMRAQKRLTWFTAGYNQISTIFPFVVVAPAYFSGAIQLGPLMQTASAFSSVQGSFSFFISSYTTLAEWTAVVTRLSNFEAAIAAARRAAQTPSFARISDTDTQATVTLEKMDVRLPDATALIQVEDLSLARGERVLLMGPSGAGKSTLLRAIAGIWPFGAGRVKLAPQTRLMILPQKPYVPVGRLDAALTYPDPPETYTPARLKEVLEAVGLGALSSHLEDTALWPSTLSPGEQQRLSLARAVLARPSLLMLDEATAALDDASQDAVYEMLRRSLPDTTILSIGHHESLRRWHDQMILLDGAALPRRLREPVAA